MPTYDFKCENGHIFEVFLKKIYDEKVDKIFCPDCFVFSVKRLFSKQSGGFILNGTGWTKNNNTSK